MMAAGLDEFPSRFGLPPGASRLMSKSSTTVAATTVNATSEVSATRGRLTPR
jgi:hypothetical protein